MNTRSILSALAATAASLTMVVMPVLAQTTPPPAAGSAGLIKGGLDAAATGYGKAPDLPVIVGSLINVALSLLGSLLLIYLIYGGFLWMTAGGDEKKVDKARSLLKNAVIGIVIVAAAYSIATYVITQLGVVTTGGT